jgi:hypothetical protein
MGLGDINNVSIAIPYQLHGIEWVIPTKVHAANPWPMRRKIAGIDGNPVKTTGNEDI